MSRHSTELALSRMAKEFVYKYCPWHLNQLKSERIEYLKLLSLISEIGCDDHLEIEICMLMHKYAAKNPFLGEPKCSIWFFSKTPKTTF